MTDAPLLTIGSAAALLIYIAIVGALALSTIRHPATAIAGVICMYGLEQWAQGSHPFFVQHQSLTNYAFGSIVLLGLAKKIYRGQSIWRGYPAVGLLVFTLFLYALVSTWWAPYPEQSLHGLLSQGPYIIINVFLSPLLCSNGEDLSRVLTATLVLGAVLVFLLLFTVEWQYRSIVFPDVEYNGNPAAIGALGGTMFLLAAYFTWSRFKLLNVLKWVVAILGLVLAIRSGSRGQTLGAVIALLAFWPVAYRLGNLKAYLLLGFGIILIAAATSWGVETFWSGSKRWTEEGMVDSADGRIYRSGKIYEYWFTNPATIFFGVGNSSSQYLIGTYAHIVLADILCEEGIAGLVMFLGIFVISIKNGWLSFKLVRRDPFYRMQLAILCAVLFYNFLLSLKEGNLVGSSLLFMFSILIGKFHKLVSDRHRGIETAKQHYSDVGHDEP